MCLLKVIKMVEMNLENMVAVVKAGLGFILTFPDKAPERITTGPGWVEEVKPNYVRAHFPEGVLLYSDGTPKKLGLTAYITPGRVTVVGTTGNENYKIPLETPNPRRYVPKH